MDRAARRFLPFYVELAEKTKQKFTLTLKIGFLGKVFPTMSTSVKVELDGMYKLIFHSYFSAFLTASKAQHRQQSRGGGVGIFYHQFYCKL